MTATAVAPDMSAIPIRIEQVAPGRYVGEFPSEMAGSYLVVVNPGAGKAPIRTGVSVGYSPEYRDNETNTSLLESIARIPAGETDGPAGQYVEEGLAAAAGDRELAENPFRRDLPQAVTNQSIWPWLVVAAAALFWTDVFVRRVQLDLTWLWAALARVRDRVLRRQLAVPEPATMSRLRSRKQQIGEQLEGRRAAARFQLDEGDTRQPSSAPLFGLAQDQPERPTPSTTAPESRPDAAREESYTERLLRAKKQARRDRDEE
jgi:hypothetical protein